MSKEDFRFHFSLRVRWVETDLQGVVFYASYMNYLEVAQAEYYRHLGFSLYDLGRKGTFDTAAVKITIEFKAPARPDEVLDIYTRVSSIGTTSITMDTEIYREGSEKLLTKAQAIYVSYDAAQGASRWVPEDVRTLVSHFEETGEVIPIERFPGLQDSPAN